MNPQQTPDQVRPDNTFRTINGRFMIWRGHRCEGADVHPGVRLIWTLCGKDVPASGAYLACGSDDGLSCMECALVLDQEKLNDLAEPMGGEGQ